MTHVIINPGSGPVADATEAEAIDNMKHFVVDCAITGLQFVRVPNADEDGRFGFLLWKETRCHLIEMPGIPLDNVRYMNRDEQNIWDYPRLYVDGSSWVWIYALLKDTEDWE